MWELIKNADHAHFVLSSVPWFVRGAAHSDGVTTGVFAFSNASGHVYVYVSFRVVLRP